VLLIDPEISDPDPNFKKIAFTGPMTDHNKGQHKKRARIGFKCPRKYKIACASCPVGYVQCPASVHREMFTLKDCKECGKKGFHDPEEPLKMCVNCVRDQTLKPEGT